MTYQSPGVYIEEVPSGPQPIAAAPTSVVAVLGTTRKGPVLKPTRVTGWSDFVRVFGTATSRSFTAESVFGFFENGGPAAYIVRVDPSVGAQWLVSDSTPAASFTVDAISPGAWANDVSLAVAPDFTGGLATMARATVSGPVNVTAAAIDVPVSSPGGLAINDTVTLINSAGDTRAAVVNDVTATTVRVTKSGGAALALDAGDTIALAVAGTATVLTFAAGSGIRTGDLLVLQRADASRVTARVASAVPDGASLTVTLAAPLGAAIDAAGLAPRRTAFAGTIAAKVGALNLGDIAWAADPAVVPHTQDGQLTNARAIVSTGVEAQVSGTTFSMPAGGDFPSGAISVDGQVRVAVFSQTIDLSPANEAEVVSQFSFLPIGTAIRLTNGTDTTTVTRTGAATGTSAGDGLAHTFTTATFVLPNDASLGVVVKCAVAPRVGDYVAFAANTLRITGVDNPSGNIYVLDFAATANISAATNPDAGRFPLLAVTATQAFPYRFSLRVLNDGAVVETFSSLALDPTHPTYFARDDVVNGVSTYVTLNPRAGGAPAIASGTMPAIVTRTRDGVDNDAGTSDYAAGLAALEVPTEPAMVIVPDAVRFEDPLLQADLVGKVITHCEQQRRFAIIDTPDIDEDTELLAWRNTAVSSTYASVYAPHVKIVTIDPDSIDRYTTVPPSGFVAGVFARTDRERGVHKAPGNERVNGIVGLTQDYTQRRQDLLNPGSVNLIRAFPGRGIRLWGARNATDDVTWRYVNVRRLFNMIETSVERSTQWVVFEPNTASTWIRIKVSVENFLDQQWRAGALAGTKPTEAYRVRVGIGETMTETDVDLGLVITEVAIAPAKPAEFVVFRFSHKRLAE
ncbi:phage tail sheath subtilisin-like domain-containing protein [Demequina sp.]|uniref:phage tail sheath subtilisin-like domain-containing protein n=1 Tax=Demequina sp. TaxID=2050685 RepID=UPI003D119A42